MRYSEGVSTAPQNFTDIDFRYVPYSLYKTFANASNKSAEGKQAFPYLLIAMHPASPFKYSPVGHVITGDFNIVSNQKLCDTFCKAPKYRLLQKVDWFFNWDEKGALLAPALLNRQRIMSKSSIVTYVV